MEKLQEEGTALAKAQKQRNLAGKYLGNEDGGARLRGTFGMVTLGWLRGEWMVRKW